MGLRKSWAGVPKEKFKYPTFKNMKVWAPIYSKVFGKMGGVVKNVGGLEINISQISNWLPARARLTITFVSYNQPGLTCEEEI